MQCHARLAGAVLLLSRAALAHAAMPVPPILGPPMPALSAQGAAATACARRAAREAAVAAAAGQRHRASAMGPSAPLPRAGFAVAGKEVEVMGSAETRPHPAGTATGSIVTWRGRTRSWTCSGMA